MDETENVFTDKENLPENNCSDYDSFRAEPTGFRQFSTPTSSAADVKTKRKVLRNERVIIALFLIIILITLALGIYGIIADIAMSGKNLSKYENINSVVIYQNSKPSGADDNIFEKDENGKFTTEGVAAFVRDSIVEIYAFSDAQRKDPQGTGSGVILTADGYIATNAHVLYADGYHDIKTADGKVYPAKIVGRDAKTDIAVIKVSTSDFSPAVLGDSDEVIVGEQVVAVGNPAGLSNTVTDGIVSAVNRKVRSDSTGFQMDCIQTNADINFGNSGGALVNMYGQVIGITSSKYASTIYEGLGFAITINEAKPIIEELINKGFVGGRFRIGITLIGTDSASGRASIESVLGYSLPENFDGIYIEDISEDCDISNTELKPGDFITKINGSSVKSYDELYSTISESFKAGDKVPATCAHVDENGKITEYKIEFRLMEDTSGNF